MTNTLDTICEEIEALASVADENSVARLVSLTDDFFQQANAEGRLEVWFRFFERFPEEDGFETFWSILHGIERLPGYETLVVGSVERRVSQFPVLMINRVINGGITTVEGMDLISLLEAVAESPSVLPSVREDALGFLEYQRAKI